MYFIIGSEGFLGKKIQLIFPKSKTINVSSKRKKNCISASFIDKLPKKANKWIEKIKSDDTIILLSNAGSINFSEKYPHKLKFFENSLEKNFFLKVNKKAKIIFFSSDMVYSGNKTIFSDKSIARPTNNYGKSKKRLENKIKKYFKKYLILRFSKIFSTNVKDRTMYSDIINSVKKRKYVELFDDQYVHYLDIRDFLNGFKKLVIKFDQLKGIFNYPGKQFTTRYKFAKKILLKNKLNTRYLVPIKVKDKNINVPLRLNMKTNLFNKIKYYPQY